jgi:hypothetical protein
MEVNFAGLLVLVQGINVEFAARLTVAALPVPGIATHIRLA